MKQFTEINTPSPQRKVSHASVYSAHIQEAMRFDRLPSSEYPLVMTILDAVLQGYTEDRWQEGQQRTVNALRLQTPAKGIPHADEANRYEQIVSYLKDLALWPW